MVSPAKVLARFIAGSTLSLEQVVTKIEGLSHGRLERVVAQPVTRSVLIHLNSALTTSGGATIRIEGVDTDNDVEMRMSGSIRPVSMASVPREVETMPKWGPGTIGNALKALEEYLDSVTGYIEGERLKPEPVRNVSVASRRSPFVGDRSSGSTGSLLRGMT